MRLFGSQRHFGGEGARPVSGVAAGVLREKAIANAREHVWLHLPDVLQVEPEAETRLRASALLVALLRRRVAVAAGCSSSDAHGLLRVRTQEQQAVRRHLVCRRTARRFDLRQKNRRIQILLSRQSLRIESKI